MGWIGYKDPYDAKIPRTPPKVLNRKINSNSLLEFFRLEYFFVVTHDVEAQLKLNVYF